MKHLKNFKKSKSFKKESVKTLKYFDLTPMLQGLESMRPGIEDRVWKFLIADDDIQFSPINGRIGHFNLHYYGIGDEYETEYAKEHPTEIAHSKKMHPEAFVKGSKESELRKDFNLIWSIYEKDIDDVEMFYYMVQW